MRNNKQILINKKDIEETLQVFIGLDILERDDRDIIYLSNRTIELWNKYYEQNKHRIDLKKQDKIGISLTDAIFHRLNEKIVPFNPTETELKKLIPICISLSKTYKGDLDEKQ